MSATEMIPIFIAAGLVIVLFLISALERASFAAGILAGYFATKYTDAELQEQGTSDELRRDAAKARKILSLDDDAAAIERK